MPRKRKALLKKHEIQIAERQRTCKHSGNAITKGEACLVVWDSQFDYRPYCKDIALHMIEDARVQLDQLESELKGRQETAIY